MSGVGAFTVGPSLRCVAADHALAHSRLGIPAGQAIAQADEATAACASGGLGTHHGTARRPPPRHGQAPVTQSPWYRSGASANASDHAGHASASPRTGATAVSVTQPPGHFDLPVCGQEYGQRIPAIVGDRNLTAMTVVTKTNK
jgi:hypothetical protein